MSEVITTPAPLASLDLPRDAERLAGLDNAGLKAELAKALEVTVKHVVRLAYIVRLLEERGEDLSSLRLSILRYVRKVAYGQLVPDAVVKFSGSPSLLDRVAVLPLPEQRALVESGSVEIIVPRTDGEWDKRRVDPAHLTRDQLHQVFGGGRIRNEPEQKLYLEDRLQRPKRQGPRPGEARGDRSRNGIVVGRTFVPQAEALRALAELRPERASEEGDDEVSVVLKLDTATHTDLKVAAARAGLTLGELVLRTLRAAGVVGGEA